MLFIQEYSDDVHDYFRSKEEYHTVVDQEKDSMIVLRRNTFKNFKSSKEVPMELLDKLNFNNRAPLVVVDNYIIICVHLASKKEKN